MPVCCPQGLVLAASPAGEVLRVLSHGSEANSGR